MENLLLLKSSDDFANTIKRLNVEAIQIKKHPIKKKKEYPIKLINISAIFIGISVVFSVREKTIFYLHILLLNFYRYNRLIIKTPTAVDSA